MKAALFVWISLSTIGAIACFAVLLCMVGGNPQPWALGLLFFILNTMALVGALEVNRG